MESQQPPACQEADLEGFCLVPLAPSSPFTSSFLAQGRKIMLNPVNLCPKWSPCGPCVQDRGRRGRGGGTRVPRVQGGTLETSRYRPQGSG